ncbi:Chloride channel protein 2, partial [Toxocara canis]
SWLAYPITVAVIGATVTHPHGYGRFITGRFKFTRLLRDFFVNCTWSVSTESLNGCPAELIKGWTQYEGYGPHSVFLVLSLFASTFFLLTIFSNTLPVPCGMFMPLFIVGASLGRLIGEFIASKFPDGFEGGTDQPVYPGVYSVVGAAALTGAVTHSVSVAVIVFELTGQLIYILPVMIAVIIANAVSTYLQPSTYDSMIQIKLLPYLPDIPPSNSSVHSLCAEQFMASPVRSVCCFTSYENIRQLLIDMPRLRSFPVVDRSDSLMLLGSVPRHALVALLENHLGDNARRAEAERRIRTAIETIDKHIKAAQFVREDTESEDEAGRSIRHERNGSSIDSSGSIGWERRRCASVDLGNIEKPLEMTPLTRQLSRFTVMPASNEQRVNTARKKRNYSPMLGRKFPRRHAFSCAAPTILPPPRGVNVADASEAEIAKDESNKAYQRHISLSTEAEKEEQEEVHIKQHLPRLGSMSGLLRTARKRVASRLHEGSPTSSIRQTPYDLTDEERRSWELERLKDTVELGDDIIDPAPFQLVRRTSLYKVHSLFSLLDLNRAYVTDRGRLVGVVGISDLRNAIERTETKNHSANKLDRAEDGKCERTKEDSVVVIEKPSSFRVAFEITPSVEPYEDILNPPLKIIHPSSASLHAYHHRMLVIEEELPCPESRHSSARSTLSLPCSATATSANDQPRTVEFDCGSIGDDNEEEGHNRLAEAVIYVHQKSVFERTVRRRSL